MQRRCNLPIFTSFLFSLEVRSLFLLQADFLSLEFSLFCCREISYRLNFSFRCEATFTSPRIVFLIFVSVSCIHSGRWIHQIHAGGQTSYKIRQKFRRPKKSLAPPYLFWSFRLLISRFLRAFLSRVTHESDQLPREETGASHLIFVIWCTDALILGRIDLESVLRHPLEGGHLE